jgi:uncharacterized protein (DUF362 family)
MGTMKHKVLIMRCDDYDPDRIKGIIKEGMEELGVKPHGKTMLKPNCVLAHKEVFPHAFTREEFLEGVIAAVQEKGDAVKELSVGERCGITIPTRYVFKTAGYTPILKKYGVKPYYFDETRQVPVRINREENLRKTLFVPKPVAECDFLVNIPKFKAHPWTRLTLGLKNYIGIQDDRHRLVDHNTFLEHKIADLQEVIQPGLIAIDGIIAGQRMMLTPTPFPMGAILMGVNSCAVDTVGCHMVHVDPKDLIHLRLTSERGFGPMDLDEIDVAGDFPLEEVQAKTKGFEFCMEHVDDYFREHPNLSCKIGKFPESHSEDYCWGGCPGALQEAVHIFRGFYPDIDERMKKIRYVVGEVNGDLGIEDGEKVLFVGSCTKWQGSLNGDAIDIRGNYRSPSQVDERKTSSNDMVLKIVGASWKALKNRNKKYVHVEGCPVSVGQHVTYLSSLAGIPDVNFDRRLVVGVNIAYWQMRINRLLNRLFG